MFFFDLSKVYYIIYVRVNIVYNTFINIFANVDIFIVIFLFIVFVKFNYEILSLPSLLGWLKYYIT